MTNSDCANEWHRHHWSTDWLIGSRGCLPCSIAVGALRVAALVDTFKRTSQRRALYALVVAYACACSASLQAGSVAEDASKTDAALQVDVTDTVISSASFLPRSLNPIVVYAPRTCHVLDTCGPSGAGLFAPTRDWNGIAINHSCGSVWDPAKHPGATLQFNRSAARAAPG